MFDQDAVLETADIHDDPIRGLPDVGKAPVDHDIIPFGHRELMLISHFRGVLYGAEQAIPPGWDQGAMLDIVRRPKSLCLLGITAIEQSFKCLDDNLFVLAWRRVSA